jgi:hypothetical protein
LASHSATFRGIVLQALRQRLAVVSTENEALKSELNAFDPEFWEELEDLKHSRHELLAKVERYMATIRSLSAQLNITPSLE